MTDKKVVDLDTHKMLKVIEEQTGFTPENSNIVQAIEDAKERAQIYAIYDARQEKILQKEHDISPTQCYNSCCREHSDDDGCSSELPAVGCLFRMTSPPPNSLFYDEYMPSHKEALDRLEAHGLLKGERQRYLEECAQYGRAESTQERNQAVINGVTMIQFQQALFNCLKVLQGSRPPISIEDDGDLEIIASNVTVEMEKVLGIYPNIVCI